MTPKQTTFSIIARDPETNDIAVGGTSHWFQYYRLVPSVELGVGAVATQAETNLAYPARVYDLLRSGKSVQEAVDYVTAEDENKDIRQLLVIDKHGNTAVHTGSRCVRYSGQIVEKDFAIAGNMLANDTVLPAMKEFYFANSKLPFAERIIKTLQAGQSAGGDFRGKRSAGILVAASQISGNNMVDYKYDLRVDDHINPLDEILRLYNISNAYKFMEEGDNAAFELNDKQKAMEAYEQAYKLFPENPEIRFWYAKLMNDIDLKDKAQEIMNKLIAEDPRWQEYWKRVYEVN